VTDEKEKKSKQGRDKHLLVGQIKQVTMDTRERKQKQA